MEHSIGSKAKYVDIYIGSKGVGVDTDWFITTKTSNPAVPTYDPTWGQGRCTGTIPQQQAQWHPAASQPLKVPYGRIIPDARPGWTPNNSSAFLNWMAKPWSLMAPPAVSRVAHSTATGSESTIFTAMVMADMGARNVEHRRQHTIGRVAE